MDRSSRRSAGKYAHLRDGYHPLVGFLYGWALLTTIESGALAAVAITIAEYSLRLIGRPGAAATPVAAIAISTFGFPDLGVLAPTRVYYAMAADRSFLPAVARLHSRFRTPSVAIVLQSTWCVILALTGRYSDLLDSVVFADWIFFGLSVGTIFVFRRRLPLGPRDPGSFATPCYPWLSASQRSPSRTSIGCSCAPVTSWSRIDGGFWSACGPGRSSR